jgi:two-component system OmpR family sensor kinase
VESSAGHVRADRHLLQQALTNLVANAWQHGDGPVALCVRDRGPAVELVVSDSGTGVDPDVGERVSKRFVRGPASTGAGLGLSIVAAIAEAHGGTSGVRRSDDGHTEAWLAVPRAT